MLSAKTVQAGTQFEVAPGFVDPDPFTSLQRLGPKLFSQKDVVDGIQMGDAQKILSSGPDLVSSLTMINTVPAKINSKVMVFDLAKIAGVCVFEDAQDFDEGSVYRLGLVVNFFTGYQAIERWPIATRISNVAESSNYAMLRRKS